MSLGTLLSHYRIVSRLGSGGMGEVYLAQDTNLDRPVALKILRADLARDADRMRRFQQEAKAVAALSHPHIAHIYEIGEHAGTHFLAMEFVEGQTLSQRLAAGPLPLTESLDIARQVAEALDEAHRRHITHRDIKPANIMIGPRGVKVLDFGVAKIIRGGSESALQDGATQDSTAPGVLLGTPYYMSPEQALGHDVDSRSDIFSLGAVLYEMVTGRRPFEAGNWISILEGILKRSPERPSLLNAQVPPELDGVIGKALEKDRDLRYQSVAELRDDLMRATALVTLPRERPVFSARPRRKLAIWVAAGILVVVALVVAVRWSSPRSSPPEGTFNVAPLTSNPGNELSPTFSPDGSQVAYAADAGSQEDYDIYVKVIGSTSQLRLTSTKDVDHSPAWSPDGRSIAFLRVGEKEAGVYTISPVGGPEKKLIDVNPYRSSVESPFCAWSPDSRTLAVVDRESREEPMSIVLLDVSTRAKRRLTFPPSKSMGDSMPCFSPDGNQLAFVRSLAVAVQDLYIVPVAGGQPRRLTERNRWIRGMTWGPDDDSLIFAWYTVGNPGLWRVSVSSRKTDRVRGLPENAVSVAVSRQGKRLAYSRSVADTNIWEYPLPPVADRSSRPVRLISSTRHEQGPQYSPDGKKIAFASTRSGSWEIYVCSNDGTNPIQLTNFDGPPTGTPHWSPDGRQIAFDSRPGGNPDIYLVAAEGSPPRRLTTEATQEILPSWSRDGKWVYFVSNRTGSNQLWKIPPSGGTAVQVTKLGGVHAQESPDGKYVYYSKSLNEPGLWRVPVTGGTEEEVLGSLRTGYWGYWWVVQDGVYYADREESQPNHSRYFLKLFHFPTRKTTQVLEFEKRPYNSGLSISPDRRRVLYTQLDQIDTDIMLVENFR